VDLHTPRNPTPQLRVLGGATLLDERGPEHGAASRRHPLALLVLLATAPTLTLSRAKLIGLLWPDVDEATGRNRLTSVLYHVRQRLGPTAVISVGDTLRLDTDAIDCDLWQFQQSLEHGDHATAVRLYRGPFLDGFHLDGAVEFDQRIEQERQRLRHTYWEALESLAERAEDDGIPSTAVRWWRERAALDPYDTSISLRLIEVLVAAGNPAEALRVAEEHEIRLQRELGASPHADLAAALQRLRALPEPPTAKERSIAVLLFEALGGGEAGSVIADGIHVGLLSRLSEVTGLGVIARTTMLLYARSGRTISEIGRELGVDWVLEGDIQASDQRFRLGVRLVHARSERQIWARQYRGDLATDDLFQLQADTAMEIIGRLKIELSPEEQEQVGRRPTQSMEAYRLWAEGRRHLERRSVETMQRSVDCFERSVELDPNYVDAWAGLANALGLLHAYGHVPGDVLERAEAAIDTALELDPRSAEAHAALGRLFGQRNWVKEAQRELELAVALKPGYAEAHSWLSVGNHASGRRDAALENARRALELDPLSPEVIYNFASAQLINGERERALEELRRLRDLVPAYESAPFLEAITLYELHRYDEAAPLVRDLEVPWAGAGPRSVRALIMVASGDRAGARRILQAIDRSRYPFDVGLVLGALGEKDAALETLGKVDFQGLDFWSSFWPTIALRYMFSDVWDLLRDEPRFADLVLRMNRRWGLR
jgi:DNA-binding SARP family transcriptional activator/Tfp pilus assembly protein PilF